MKYINQLGVVLAVTFVGEAIHKLLPVPIPASIYGLLIMLFCLTTKIVRLEKVKEAGDLLLETMPLMFIPVTVGLITVWSELADIVIPIAVITLLTTVIVMAATGKMTQLVMRKSKGDKNERYL